MVLHELPIGIAPLNGIVLTMRREEMTVLRNQRVLDVHQTPVTGTCVLPAGTLAVSRDSLYGTPYLAAGLGSPKVSPGAEFR